MPENSLPKDFQYKWAVKNACSIWYQSSPLSLAMEEHIPYTHMCTLCITHTKSSNYLPHYETWASEEQTSPYSLQLINLLRAQTFKYIRKPQRLSWKKNPNVGGEQLNKIVLRHSYKKYWTFTALQKHLPLLYCCNV